MLCVHHQQAQPTEQLAWCCSVCGAWCGHKSVCGTASKTTSRLDKLLLIHILDMWHKPFGMPLCSVGIYFLGPTRFLHSATLPLFRGHSSRLAIEKENRKKSGKKGKKSYRCHLRLCFVSCFPANLSKYWFRPFGKVLHYTSTVVAVAYNQCELRLRVPSPFLTSSRFSFFFSFATVFHVSFYPELSTNVFTLKYDAKHLFCEVESRGWKDAGSGGRHRERKDNKKGPEKISYTYLWAIFKRLNSKYLICFGHWASLLHTMLLVTHSFTQTITTTINATRSRNNVTSIWMRTFEDLFADVLYT